MGHQRNMPGDPSSLPPSHTFLLPPSSAQVSSPDYVTSFVPSLTSGTCSSLTERLLEDEACKRVIQEQQGLIRNTLTLLIQFSCVTNPFAPSFGGPGGFLEYGNASDYPSEYPSNYPREYNYGGDYDSSQRRKKRGASWMVHDGEEGRKPGSLVSEAGGFKTELEYRHTRHCYPWICSLRTRNNGAHLCAATLLSVPPSATVMISTAHCTLHCSSSEGETLPSCCCSSLGRQSCSSNEKCREGAEVTGIPADRLEVLCGEWQTGGGSDEEEYNILLPVMEVTRHPDYSLTEGPGQGSDIAVLKVDDSQLADYAGGRVFPACLPKDARPAVGVHSGWSRAPTRKFLERYAPGFLPYYNDFLKQWHYKMDIQPTCQDPNISQIFGQTIASPSDSFYPSGSLCAKDFSRQSCFSSGESGAPLMTEDSQTGRLHVEGIFSFVKGCETFTIGATNDKRTEWQLTQLSENPLVYVELSCFLPWVAEQYGLTFPTSPSCSAARGDSATNLACTETISNLFSTEHPCIFPFFYEGRRYNECIQFEQDGFLLPVFRCPVRNITTKVDGVSAFTFLEPTHGYCLNDQVAKNKATPCTVPHLADCAMFCIQSEGQSAG